MKGPGWCSNVRGLGRTGGAHLPERLKDICLKHDVGATIQVGEVSQGLAPKGRPDLLRIGVVLVTDMCIGELAVEGFLLWGSLGSVKRSQVVHILVLVRINTLSQ